MARVNERPDFGVGVERVAHPDVRGALGNSAGEFVVDALLNQHPAGGRAALAVEAVDHEHHGIECLVEIGVVEDHHRVFAAQLEVHALEGVGPLPHDVAAGGSLAHEGHRLDQRVLGQRLARALAEAVYEVVHPSRQPGLVHDFGQQRGAHRRPLGGFVHHRATGSQRGRDFPGAQHERRVPGCNHPDWADGLTNGVVDKAGRGQTLAVLRPRRAVGVEAEVLSPARRRRLHEADGLPGVHAFQHGDFLGTFLDQVGHPVQNLAPLGPAHLAPRLEGVVGGFCGPVNVLRVSLGHLHQKVVVHRRVRVEGLAAVGVHPLAADEVLKAPAQAAFAELPGEVVVLLRRTGLGWIGLGHLKLLTFSAG